MASFAAQYGHPPDAVGWNDAVSAMMLGFGIDRIRDKTAVQG